MDVGERMPPQEVTAELGGQKMDYRQELQEKGSRARYAAQRLAALGSQVKNKALQVMADNLLDNWQTIVAANAIDLANARQKGMNLTLIDRLTLTKERLAAMAAGLRQIADLPEPIGEILGGFVRPNGLRITKVRVPLGVIAIIYEARPNVTADATALCLKSGNAVILRGGSEAIHSNTVIAQILAQAASSAGIPEGAIAMLVNTGHQAVNALLRLHEYIDVVIPRGGAGLIKTVVENSSVPVIATGTGVCHTFIDASAELEMAAKIAFNAKVSRPGVCNAMETLLVHQKIAADFLPAMLEQYYQAGVELRGCERCKSYHKAVKQATIADWEAEYLDLILAVRIVDNLTEALEHIARYSTHHSEAIVTSDYHNARRFQREVDAAAVYVNASTRFTDGFEFGFGAEIGISTQKLHARGPMGLNELTTSKYLIDGDGQIR